MKKVITSLKSFVKAKADALIIASAILIGSIIIGEYLIRVAALIGSSLMSLGHLLI